MIRRSKRRRSLIVNKSLQYRFLAQILICSLIIAVFLATWLFVPDIIQLENEGLSFEVRSAAANRILTLHSRAWPAVIALICFLGLYSFRSFHRLAGPLHRFRWAFERVRNGDLGIRVRIRQKDYLHQEEEELNEMIEMLAGKLRSIQMASLDASRSFGELEQTVAKKTTWRVTDKELLRIHRQHLDTLRDAAGYFCLQEGDNEPHGQGS